MKNIQKYIVFGVFAMLPLFGCDSDELVELNIDPTQANSLDWRFVFTTGQVWAAENRYVNGRVHLNLCSGLIQQTATLSVGPERASGDKYLRHLDSFNAYMDRVYETSMKPIAEVIRQTGADGLNPEMVNLHHMAQVLYILPMHIMTDLYGNVPYSEANRGVEGIFFPVFDSQESIYKDMLAKLETAANTIGSGADDVGSADLFYGGDMDKWKKLANSLMLRLAMRISNVDPGTAQSFVQKAISGGVMESNDDMCFINMSSGPSQWFNQNGLSRALIPDDWGANQMMGKTLVDWLQERNDPRLGIWGATGPWGGPYNQVAAEQVGLPNGLEPEDLDGISRAEEEMMFSRINPALLDVDDPFILMTHAEVELLLAEASLKGWNSGDAGDHFNNGIRSSMQQWTVFGEGLEIANADVDAYLAANPFDGSEQMVGEQLWAANFMQWYEAYASWRRTGFPELTPVNFIGNISGGEIFRRFEYNTVEVASNPNFQAGATLPDDVMTRIWWDVN